MRERKGENVQEIEKGGKEREGIVHELDEEEEENDEQEEEMEEEENDEEEERDERV